MGRIWTYLDAQLHSKLLTSPPKNPTISTTKIAWFWTMPSRAIRVHWLKSGNGSQNEGLYIEKSCVRFQTDGIAVSWTATVPAWLTYKWSRAFPGCIKSDSSVSCRPVSLQMEGQHRGIRTSPQSRGSMKKWWRNRETSGPIDKKLMSPRFGSRSAMP